MHSRIANRMRANSARQAIEVNRIADLPSDWFGYEAVDVLLISAGDGKLCRELAADEPRLEALSQWVELGGRLVVMCDGQAAQDLFAAGKPLAKFAPGNWPKWCLFGRRKRARSNISLGQRPRLPGHQSR